MVVLGEAKGAGQVTTALRIRSWPLQTQRCAWQLLLMMHTLATFAFYKWRIRH